MRTRAIAYLATRLRFCDTSGAKCAASFGEGGANERTDGPHLTGKVPSQKRNPDPRMLRTETPGTIGVTIRLRISKSPYTDNPAAVSVLGGQGKRKCY